jgi:hypothetical protein
LFILIIVFSKSLQSQDSVSSYSPVLNQMQGVAAAGPQTAVAGVHLSGGGNGHLFSGQNLTVGDY